MDIKWNNGTPESVANSKHQFRVFVYSKEIYNLKDYLKLWNLLLLECVE